MKPTMMLGAVLGLLGAGPAFASDASADRAAALERLHERGAGPALVRSADEGVAPKPARDTEGRPCCVAHGAAAVDHLRG